VGKRVCILGCEWNNFVKIFWIEQCMSELIAHEPISFNMLQLTQHLTAHQQHSYQNMFNGQQHLTLLQMVYGGSIFKKYLKYY
jgi:hypothetical protein